MAIYHASTKPIARSAGRSAVAAAAYRAGVELVDARTGLVHDYTRRGGVEHTEILTPDGLGAERNALWDATELAEKRKDARTAREWIVALPSELTAGQRTDLARDFAQALVDRYGVAVDFAVHAPDREGDHRNHHAHILTTTRQVSRGIDGGLVLGAKAHIELSDKARRENGLGAAADEVKAVRELWERVANAALERAGVEARIDARSLQAQGVDREATQHLGPVASEMERRGKASDRGDGNRQVSDHNRERARLSAEIIDLHAERERRERREAARREFEQSHREPAPDHLSVGWAVAALVATQAQRARQATQERWTERRRQRAALDMEVRRGRLVALADALAKDQACRLPLRQAYLDAGYQVQRQGDKEVSIYPHDDMEEERKAVRVAWQGWNQRKQGLARDSVTDRETLPGVRHPDKPRWQTERERILTEAYGAELAEKLGRWYRIERGPDGITLSNREATITDHGDRITSRDGNGREIEAMVELARAKGWERVSLTGTAEFQGRAARAFVEAGFGLTDTRLEQTAQDAIEADRREAGRERAAREREAALVDQQERETRPGIRHADRSQWAVDRDWALSRKYDQGYTERAEGSGFYSRWMDDEQGLFYERKKDGVRFIDQGPVIVVPREERYREGAPEAYVLYAQARGWRSIDILGDEAFRLRAAKVALEEGLTVSDPDLTKRAEAALDRESRRERLAALADALAKDQACGLSIRRAYLDAGYQVQQQGDKQVLIYPHDDLLAERKDVSAARKAWDQRKREQKVPKAQISAYGAEYARRDGWKGSFTGAVIAVDEGHVYVGAKGGGGPPHCIAIPKDRFKAPPPVGLYATFSQGDGERPAGWSKVLGRLNGQGRLVRDQEKGKGIGD